MKICPLQEFYLGAGNPLRRSHVIMNDPQQTCMISEPLKSARYVFYNLTRIKKPLFKLQQGGRLLHCRKSRPYYDIDQTGLKNAASNDPGLSGICTRAWEVHRIWRGWSDGFDISEPKLWSSFRDEMAAS